MERFVFIALIAAAPSVATAQRVIITPTLGRLIPLSAQQRWFIPTAPPCDVGPCDPLEAREELEGGALFGVGAAAKLTSWVGIEIAVATGALERQRLYGQDNVLGSGDLQGSVRYGMTTMRLFVDRRIAPTVTVGVAVGASRTTLSGGSLKRLSGDSARPPIDATQWGASIAATVGVVVMPRLHARFNVTDNIYRLGSIAVGRQPNPPMDQERGLQHDLLLSMGVGISILP